MLFDYGNYVTMKVVYDFVVRKICLVFLCFLNRNALLRFRKMNQIVKYGSVEAIPLYNCSAMSPDEWTTEFGLKRPILDIISIIYGSLMDIITIPCLLVILDHDLFQMSCYKIMFVVGVVDMLEIAMNSIFTGFLAIEGAVFCTHPVFIYFLGLSGLGLWCCSCLLNILLLVNRTLNFANSTLSDYFFDGYRTYGFIVIPIVYGLYFVLFTPTCVFSSRYYAWFYDPFIFPNMTSEYTNVPHGVNNVMIIIGTSTFYAYICILLYKTRKTASFSRMTTQANQIFYQSVVICFINQIFASIYVVMNFVMVPEWMIVLAQLLWQLDHGMPVIIYLTMNATMRSRFLKKIQIKKKNNSTAPVILF